MCSLEGLLFLCDTPKFEPTLADLLNMDMLLIRRVDGLRGVCNFPENQAKLFTGYLTFNHYHSLDLVG